MEGSGNIIISFMRRETHKTTTVYYASFTTHPSHGHHTCPVQRLQRLTVGDKRRQRNCNKTSSRAWLSTSLPLPSPPLPARTLLQQPTAGRWSCDAHGRVEWESVGGSIHGRHGWPGPGEELVITGMPTRAWVDRTRSDFIRLVASGRLWPLNRN